MFKKFEIGRVSVTENSHRKMIQQWPILWFCLQS